MQVAKKNTLITMLVDHVWENEPGLTDELSPILNELTTLNRSENSRVALRARQVRIKKLLRNIYYDTKFLSRTLVLIYYHIFTRRFSLLHINLHTNSVIIKWSPSFYQPLICTDMISIQKIFRSLSCQKLLYLMSSMTSFSIQTKPFEWQHWR